MFALRKSRQKPTDCVMAEAKDRKADRYLCHADSPDGCVLVCVVLEDLLCEEVLDLRLIMQHLEISALQQLRPSIV
jgi:hypothetical protein